MLLVVATLNDTDALWFARKAEELVGTAPTFLTTEALAFAHRRSHRVSDDGASTVIEVTPGTVIEDARLTGVLNRSIAPPDIAWKRAALGEREYASAELHAFMLSWLTALGCPIRNRPSYECLAGPAPHPFATVAAAVEAGLSCPPVNTGSSAAVDCSDALAAAAHVAAGPRCSSARLVCLDGTVFGGDAPDEVRAGVRRFVGLVGAAEALVGVDFLVRGETWWFAGMTPWPNLRAGGVELVARLVSVLAP